MSDLDELQATWNTLGREDPLWAVLSTPDKRGNRWDVDEFFATGREEIASLMQRIGDLDIDQRRHRALDFGCGVGRLTQGLAEHFDKVDGVDIAPSMIELARGFNRHEARCEYHVNAAPDLRLFADDTFDLVYTRLVLQHMKPKFAKAYIAEFIRVLQPGALAVFLLPSSMPPVRQLLYSVAKARRAVLKPLSRSRREGALQSSYKHPLYTVRKSSVLSILRRTRASLVRTDEAEVERIHDILYYAVKLSPLR